MSSTTRRLAQVLLPRGRVAASIELSHRTRTRPAGPRTGVVRQKSADAYRRDILAIAVTRVSHISDHVEGDIRSTDALSIERNGLRAMRAHAAPMSSWARRQVWRLRCVSFVAMMKSADFRNRDDRLSGRCRDWSRIWRVLLEPKMGPSPMIVSAVDREDASQMRLVEHDHVIQAFATD